MKNLFSSIRTNILYGAIALLPVAVLAFIVFKLSEILQKLLGGLSPILGTNSFVGIGLLIIVAILTLLFLCFLFGVFVNTKVGALLIGKISSGLGENIPGYNIITNLMSGMAGGNISYPPALITLYAPGAVSLGFVMEDTGGQYLTVFIPLAPLMTVGAIHLVECNRVELIEGSSINAANCVTQWGLGLEKFRSNIEPPKPVQDG
ncbi:MAG: hypothetical protein GY742_19680 [Hyphomicrobiales bacterium]|nr:hypothetical protein [Hyphomicrobiales bacterium]